MEHYADLAVFVRIVDNQGFAKAATSMGVSPAQVSRTLSRLEDRLGVRLLNRTTRRIALTEDGQALYDRARALLNELDEAEAAIRDRSATLRGTLKVSLPVHFGIHVLAPIIARFAHAHPHLFVDLSFSDRRIDLVADGFDVAVRIGPLSDSSLIARRLGQTRVFTAASPAYLAARGVPTHPDQLVGHDCLLYRHEGTGTNWRFTAGDEDITVRVTGRIVTDNGEALVAAAIADLGIGRFPETFAGDAVRRGALVPLLSDYDAVMPVSAVYPPGRHLTPKVRAFVDFLASQCLARQGA